MADKEVKSGLRKFFTVVTSPIWVPVAAVGGLVAAPFQAAGDSIDEAEKTDNAAKGIGALPGNFVGRVVTNPFKAIGKVGEAMWDDEKKKISGACGWILDTV